METQIGRWKSRNVGDFVKPKYVPSNCGLTVEQAKHTADTPFEFEVEKDGDYYVWYICLMPENAPHPDPIMHRFLLNERTMLINKTLGFDWVNHLTVREENGGTVDTVEWMNGSTPTQWTISRRVQEDGTMFYQLKAKSGTATFTMDRIR